MTHGGWLLLETNHQNYSQCYMIANVLAIQSVSNEGNYGYEIYWPRIRQDIENWIKCCRSCMMAKHGLKRSKHPLQEISGAPFDRVSFDVIGPLQMLEIDSLLQ